jgi:FkbM family methyltransferase
MRHQLKKWLADKGWFIRKTAGLPIGVDLHLDLQKSFEFGAPKVLFDVGAHRGETANALNRTFPNARIFSFEPISSNFEALRRNVVGKNIECINAALGEKSEKVTIQLQEDSQTHTLRERAISTSKNTETLSVSTLDEFCAERNITSIDLLKIDTEGYEVPVIRGGAKLVRSGAIRCILVEASLDRTDRCHTALVDVISELAPHDYQLAAIYDQVVWQKPTRLAYFNALFCR